MSKIKRGPAIESAGPQNVGLWTQLVAAGAADEPDQEQHHGDDQENPDEVPERVATDHPQQPEDDQDDRDGLEHGKNSLDKEPTKDRHHANLRLVTLTYYKNMSKLKTPVRESSRNSFRSRQLLCSSCRRSGLHRAYLRPAWPRPSQSPGR